VIDSGGVRLPERETFSGFAGCLAAGVSVIVAMADGEPLATTASSTVAASLDPPLLVVFFRAGSRMAAALDHCEHFTVNLLGEADHGLARRFAHPGREQGWAALSDVLRPRPVPAPPHLAAAYAWADCVVTETIRIGDHHGYVGHVLAFERRPEPAPLVLYRGRLRGIGAAVTPVDWEPIAAGDLAAVW
jgi:flavin reductase (DIM6/NTAB) family NADH-FMN oxidoreductase RutF